MMDGRCCGCGYCCITAPCGAFPVEDVQKWRGCPELEFDGERHWCGLVLRASDDIKETLYAGLAIGAGCCSGLNSWRREPIQDRTVCLKKR